MSTCGTITSASLFAIAPFGVSVIQASCQLDQKKKMAQRREKAIEMNTDGSDKLERGPPSPQISISSRSVQAMQSFRIGTLLILLFLPFAALQCPVR